MKTIGGHQLLAEMARGGMGIVHLARREGTDELVVVKELRPELSSDVVYRDMFVDEGRLAKKLHHAHIVRTDELFCEDGRWLMAMELLRGASLHQVRAKVGLRGIPVRFAVRILATVLDGLHYAHERGVVHRDVSAQNVFLGWDGSVKLIDFGVAKSDAPRQSTQVGIVKGSVPYLSPDHLEPKTIDRRADVFSVGLLLRELLTGTRMWDDADDLTILKRLVAKDLPPWPMTEGGLAIPPGLRRIAERALAMRREDRFATAAEMREALLHFLAATDAKGSLAEIGAWLGKELATEQASFEAFVEKARGPSPPPLPAERWLPSSELVTRLFSRPPPPPPPLPLPHPRPHPHPRPRPLPRVRPRARPPLRTRLPIVALVASIFAGLAIGAYFGNETVDAMQDRTEEKAAE